MLLVAGLAFAAAPNHTSQRPSARPCWRKARRLHSRSGAGAARTAALSRAARARAQCLTVATLALLVSSLATVAVPKLAGSLIDVCIQFGQEGGRAQAKRHLDTMLFQILGILAVGGVATGVRSWRAPRWLRGLEVARAWQRAARWSCRGDFCAVSRVACGAAAGKPGACSASAASLAARPAESPLIEGRSDLRARPGATSGSVPQAVQLGGRARDVAPTQQPLPPAGGPGDRCACCRPSVGQQGRAGLPGAAGRGPPMGTGALCAMLRGQLWSAHCQGRDPAGLHGRWCACRRCVVGVPPQAGERLPGAAEMPACSPSAGDACRHLARHGVTALPLSRCSLHMCTCNSRRICEQAWVVGRAGGLCGRVVRAGVRAGVQSLPCAHGWRSLPGRAGFFDRVRTGELMNRLSEARAAAHASAGWSRCPLRTTFQLEEGGVPHEEVLGRGRLREQPRALLDEWWDEQRRTAMLASAPAPLPPPPPRTARG